MDVPEHQRAFGGRPAGSLQNRDAPVPSAVRLTNHQTTSLLIAKLLLPPVVRSHETGWSQLAVSTPCHRVCICR